MNLLEPFHYQYIINAILLSALIGGICAFLSCYLILKRWSLIGDALSHSVVPGVAMAYYFEVPYAIGAFFSGIFAAVSILWIKSLSKLREDAIIGFIFTTFFAFGLLIISLKPTAINIQEIILGNILGISQNDIYQVLLIVFVSLGLLLFFWKNLMLIFFDEVQAKLVGLNVTAYKILFFTLLSACIVVALQTVGAILVIAMVITPGATAYLLTDKFSQLLKIAVFIGVITSALGVYLSYFLNGATGGVIVSLQSLFFIVAFLFSPKYGCLIKHKGVANELD